MDLLGYGYPWFVPTSRRPSHYDRSPFGQRYFPKSSTSADSASSDDECQGYCGCSECCLRRRMERSYRPKRQGHKWPPRYGPLLSSANVNGEDKSRQFGGSRQAKAQQPITSTPAVLKQAGNVPLATPNASGMRKNVVTNQFGSHQVECQSNVNDKEHSCVADRIASDDGTEQHESLSTCSADEMAIESYGRTLLVKKMDNDSSSQTESERDIAAENSEAQADEKMKDECKQPVDQASEREMCTTSGQQRCSKDNEIVPEADPVEGAKESSEQDMLEEPEEMEETVETEKSSSDIEDDVFDKLQEVMSIVGDVGKHKASIAAFTGSRKDRKYLEVEDCLVKALLNLDNIDSGSHQEVRFARKAAVKYIQKMLEDLEEHAS